MHLIISTCCMPNPGFNLMENETRQDLNNSVYKYIVEITMFIKTFFFLQLKVSNVGTFMSDKMRISTCENLDLIS